MRGIQVASYVKAAHELKVTELADPKPAPDDYLIEVHAAATNFFDILQIQGKYQHQPPFPWVSGAEFAGIVLATPANSKNPKFPVGSRVFGATQGAYATKCVAKEVSMLAVPEGWSYKEAAGLFVTAPTSYGALVVRAGVKAGDYVLVHAAAGGVGLAAVQIAKAFGATVIATAGTERKLQVAKAFGADHVVDYRDPKWPELVKKLTPKGRGVDIVYDPVGMVDKSTKCTSWNGRILIVGFAAGTIEKVAMNKVLLKNISLVGIHWGQYAVHEKETVVTVWQGIMKLIAKGKFRGTEFTDKDASGLSVAAAATLSQKSTPYYQSEIHTIGKRRMHSKVVIIGSGPAAHTAAIYLARAELKPVLYEGFMANGVAAGGQLTTTTEVENFPGFPEAVTGQELMDKMRAQSERFGTVIVSETVGKLDLSKRPFEYSTEWSPDTVMTADAVILATGASARRLGLPGEDKYWQNGISACAVCDGAVPIFRNKPLVVIGGGDSAAEEAIFLTKYGSHVTVLVRRDKLRASSIMARRLLANKKVTGLFAAGDVQDKRYRQAITSAGTGCMAALDAEKYLEELEDEQADGKL
ncbi:hypothetical protein CHGG_01790 [Chaetomium globosum CBS 148.51]|uniref:Enoyl reductase (ER) domain-containing protein n=1 Tax=Chaetomium globosum (strain ATCC 6205 / CBS 148.51 / DSM 1962 / NBRC 6347 / NRRL 1970) TaxID=306901 RepID=Q2HDB4_CHAGB|nr:uncharacterized protein CHGG_01790 [Chaetomium globosum CBS 148.51]EAQ93555.1 hypothetical protein CHGG_01790 [Chaetomium globosum CBS 148.51]